MIRTSSLLQKTGSLWELTKRPQAIIPLRENIERVRTDSEVQRKVEAVLYGEAINLQVTQEFTDLFFIQDPGNLLEEFKFGNFFDNGLKDHIGELIHIDGLVSCMRQIIQSHRPFIKSSSKEIYKKMLQVAKDYVKGCKELGEDSFVNYKDPKLAFKYAQLSLVKDLPFTKEEVKEIETEVLKIKNINLIPKIFLSFAQVPMVNFNGMRMEYGDSPRFKDRPVEFLDFLSQGCFDVHQSLSHRQSKVLFELLNFYKSGATAFQVAHVSMLDPAACRASLERLASLQLIRKRKLESNHGPKTIYYMDDLDFLRIHATKSHHLLRWCRRNQVDLGNLSIEHIDSYIREMESRMAA